MKLSIVTINRNNAAGLRKTLRSTLKKQPGFSDFEQIVVDGASSDGSMDIAAAHKGDPRLASVVSEPDTGIYNAMNKGARRARGEYLLFLNSGDVLLPGVLARVFQAPLDADIAYGNLVFETPAGAVEKRYPDKVGPEHFILSHLPHPASFISRATFKELGGYDETLKIVADAKLFLAAAFAGKYRFRHLPFAISRFQDGGISGNSEHSALLHRERLAYLSPFFGERRIEAILLANPPRPAAAAMKHRGRGLRLQGSSFLTRLHIATFYLRAAITQKNDGRPRVLFVLGGAQRGGTPFTVREIARGIQPRFHPFCLVCNERRLTLRDLSREATAAAGLWGVVIASHTLAAPVHYATCLSEEFDDVVVAWCLKYQTDIVQIDHLLMSSLGFPQRLRERGIPVALSFHDFFTACPSLNFTDASLRLWPRGVADGVTRAEIFRPYFGDAAPLLDSTLLKTWRQRFEGRVFPFCNVFTAPCEDARARLLDNHAALRARAADFKVLPHGHDFREFLPPGPAPEEGRPLVVLALGALSPRKGGKILDAIARAGDSRSVVVHAVGEVSPFFEDVIREAPRNLAFHGRYDLGNLPRIIRQIRPHLAMILSPLPETWCHTLTECWAMGLPVLAFDIGAQGGRIRSECPGGGWLLPLGTPPEEILATLRAIAADPPGYTAKAAAVQAWQCGFGARNTAAAMAARYMALYDDLLAGRQAPCFPPTST